VGALAEGTVILGPGCDWGRARRRLLELPGVGPWTTEMIAMRALGDPDAFPVADGGVRAAAKHLGLPTDARALSDHSMKWRPWRSYATQHLWATLDHPVNHWPVKENA
jgi:AraC family transcriptional regulator, regulatory protein of adaptative response / DNA-3-methyladenine glycosylase II